jgi:hypothetical protein
VSNSSEEFGYNALLLWRIIIDKECLDDGELNLYETMYESTDDGSQGIKNPFIKHSDENSRSIVVVDKSNKALYPNSSDELDTASSVDSYIVSYKFNSPSSKHSLSIIILLSLDLNLEILFLLSDFFL